jgi:beta-N-acetylhexosaminidase
MRSRKAPISSKITFAWLCVALLASCLAGCQFGGSGKPGGATAGTGSGNPAGTNAADTAASRMIAALVRRMSLSQKVGQLFVSTVPGTTAGQGGAALVRSYHLGGVIYFQPNLVDAGQVAALSNGLQTAAMAQSPSVPLTIGTDEEGGTVARLDGISTAFPGQMAAGATRDPALVRAAEHVVGQELRVLGLNLDYAPVADVNVAPANPVIGTRSFGSSPSLVATMTSAAIAGFHAAGVAAVAKHFPGHGDTNTDSHTGLPVIGHTLPLWEQIDAPPFEAAIRSGIDVIMSAHIVVPALDSSGTAATFSHEIITELLRGKLGYHGVVTTDSLQMAGAQQYSDGQIAVRAILAGCDELLMPDNLATAYAAVLAAVRSGRISTARLDESVTRIITMKFARGMFASPYTDAGAAPWQVATPADAALAQQVADKSVTVVKNAGALVPLRGGTNVYVTGQDAASLANSLAGDGLRMVASPGSAQAVVVTTADAMLDATQQGLVGSLLAGPVPVIVVAVGRPYDLGLFPGATVAIATYSDSAASMTAVASVLTGTISAVGRLPVTVPGASGGVAYPYGAGL